MNDSKIDIHWYALRVTYSRELTFKEYLDGAGIENFIPMHYEYVTKGDRRVRKLVPVVHNLVFVRSSREHINRMKDELSLPIRYIMNKETNHPIVVPERQMHHFIAVAGTNEEQLVYLEPTAVAFRKGQRVRVTGGVFEGVEGEFIRVKNDRRVMVSIQGVMAVATTFIHPSFIELINE
ncbi:UpxY family transcription antiterminator [Bacteroides sp.]